MFYQITYNFCVDVCNIELFIVLGNRATSLGDWCGMFEDCLMVPSSRVECPMKNGEPTVEDGTSALS